MQRQLRLSLFQEKKNTFLFQFNEETQTHYFSVLSTSFQQLYRHIPVGYLEKFKTELNDITSKLDIDNVSSIMKSVL